MAAALLGGGGEENQNPQGYQFLHPNTEGWAGGRDKGDARKSRNFHCSGYCSLQLISTLQDSSAGPGFPGGAGDTQTVAEHRWLAPSNTALCHSQASFTNSFLESLIHGRPCPASPCLFLVAVPSPSCGTGLVSQCLVTKPERSVSHGLRCLG